MCILRSVPRIWMQRIGDFPHVILAKQAYTISYFEGDDGD